MYSWHSSELHKPALGPEPHVGHPAHSLQAHRAAARWAHAAEVISLGHITGGSLYSEQAPCSLSSLLVNIYTCNDCIVVLQVTTESS